MPSLKWFAQRKPTIGARRASAPHPRVEELEGRWVPSTLDLTTHGAIGPINDAIFRQFDAQPTGTGVINSFVRVQSIKQAVQQGYNTDERPLQLDENKSPQFTRSLSLSEVPVVDIGGVKYREFLLDINQKASQPLLSVDELRIFMGDAPNLSGYDASNHLAGHSAVYDMGAGNWIKLDARLNQGSGKGDMLAYIPDSLFTGGTYVYLYSKFGVNYTANAGFEEWAAGKGSLTADTGSISGHVLKDSGAGIADVIVFLDANNNGVLDNNEVFAITDSGGNYSFTFLATGLGTYSDYKVTVITPITTADYTPTGAVSTSVSLQTNGQSVFGVDFLFSFNNDNNDGEGGGGGSTPPGT